MRDPRERTINQTRRLEFLRKRERVDPRFLFPGRSAGSETMVDLVPKSSAMVQLKSRDGRSTVECNEKYAASLIASGKYVRVTRQKRDRPAGGNPGGMYCDDCFNVFIGAEWHERCAICEAATKVEG